MTAAHSIKEPKPYDPTRNTSRVALTAVVVLGLVESATWFRGDRADTLVALVVQVIGVVLLPILTMMFGHLLIHDARYGDKYPAGDLVGFVALWTVSVAVAIYSGLNHSTVTLGLLMFGIASMLRVIRADQRAAA